MYRRLVEELHTFQTAVTYFTRLPPFSAASFSEARLARCVVHLPLVGWLVGAVAVFAFLVVRTVLPVPVALLLSMAATAWLTGAFHEDGWADFCDGIGSGRNRERILEIMKDPRLGTYGSLGLWGALTLKLLCLSQMAPAVLIPALAAGHGVSRLFPVLLIRTHAYVGASAASKAGSLCSPPSNQGLVFVFLTGLTPLLLFRDPAIFMALPVLTLAHRLLARTLTRKLGGYSGDCLGAAQQVAELVFYLFVLGWPWTFI